jgi:hypothetical protein
MSIDWDIYSKEIRNQVEETKGQSFDYIFDQLKDAVDDNTYWALESMIPLVDLDRDDFTLRLSWKCEIDKKDDRNILFSLKEEISDYDSGDFKRLDRLKVIFQNCISLVEEKTLQLEQQWGRE